MQRCLLLIISIIADLDMLINKHVCFLFTVCITIYLCGPQMSAILYNRNKIMLVYERQIKLSLFSHAPTSLFAHSYMLLLLNRTEQNNSLLK